MRPPLPAMAFRSVLGRLRGLEDVLEAVLPEVLADVLADVLDDVGLAAVLAFVEDADDAERLLLLVV